MKKFLLNLGVVSLMVLASCGGGVDSKLDKIEKLNEEGKELWHQQLEGKTIDEKKLEKLQDEAMKLYDELKNENLTPQQEERLQKIMWGK